MVNFFSKQFLLDIDVKFKAAKNSDISCSMKSVAIYFLVGACK